ncbi:uncharacterized protein [Hemitrygon akajei]|uniref:uncharacterized protein isoform X5 n=1 Tax=Hemitrygon akajei TaxID=2704970 RepID=UPI003BF97B84
MRKNPQQSWADYARGSATWPPYPLRSIGRTRPAYPKTCRTLPSQDCNTMAYITMGNVTYLKTIILQSSSNMTTMNNEATTPKTTHASSNMTTMNNEATTPKTTHASSNMTTMNNEATTPKTTHGNNNTTSSMINNTTTQISTSAAKKSTPQNAAGMVIGFKPLYAFTCMLLLLVTAPELLSQRV